MINDIRKIIPHSNDSIEQNVIEFIKRARSGATTSLELNNLLKKITPHNFSPIEIYEEKWNSIVPPNRFVNPLTFKNIAYIFNEYGILKRGNLWSPSSVSHVYNSHISNINNNFNNLTL